VKSFRFLLGIVESAAGAAFHAAGGWRDLSVKFVAPVGVGDEFRVDVALVMRPVSLASRLSSVRRWSS
jgi:hypothetical protein